MIDPLVLQPGIYFATVTIRESVKAPALIDRKVHCLTLRVDHGTAALGDFYMPHRWRQTTSASLEVQAGGPSTPRGESRWERRLQS